MFEMLPRLSHPEADDPSLIAIHIFEMSGGIATRAMIAMALGVRSAAFLSRR